LMTDGAAEAVPSQQLLGQEIVFATAGVCSLIHYAR